MASVLNIKSDVVVNELQMLQTLGILKGASINAQTHTISVEKVKNTVGEITGIVNSITDTVLDASSNESASMVQAACPGCGAKYTGQKGSTCECDYCAATIVFR